MNKLKNYLVAVLMISVVSCSEGTSDVNVPCADSLAVDTAKVCCDTIKTNPSDGPIKEDSIKIADPR